MKTSTACRADLALSSMTGSLRDSCVFALLLCLAPYSQGFLAFLLRRLTKNKAVCPGENTDLVLCFK